MTRKLPPLHPGEVLREEFMAPYSLTPYALAKLLLIPRTRIERIVREEVGITADTALRLARYFDTTEDFWLRLQLRYDIEERMPKITPQLKKIKRAVRRVKIAA
jgi:addiction module HigA family antidote